MREISTYTEAIFTGEIQKIFCCQSFEPTMKIGSWEIIIRHGLSVPILSWAHVYHWENLLQRRRDFKMQSLSVGMACNINLKIPFSDNTAFWGKVKGYLLESFILMFPTSSWLFKNREMKSFLNSNKIFVKIATASSAEIRLAAVINFLCDFHWLQDISPTNKMAQSFFISQEIEKPKEILCSQLCYIFLHGTQCTPKQSYHLKRTQLFFFF